MLTPERLREIKERCERATPGPWTSLSDEARGLRTMNIKVVGKSPMMLIAQTATGTTGGKVYDNGEDGRYDNAEFIAHAREDVPALVDEVERLHTLLGELRDLMGRWRREAARYQRNADKAIDSASFAHFDSKAIAFLEAASDLEDVLNRLEAKQYAQ